MELIRTIWMFFQDQILGMKWLNALIGKGLSAMGLDLDSILGGGLQFFIYDTIKIFVLLSVLIFMISYIQSYFPPERTKRILGRFHGIDTILLLFFHTDFYGIHQCRASGRSDFFISDFFTDG